jgi:hypothetical protein
MRIKVLGLLCLLLLLVPNVTYAGSGAPVPEFCSNPSLIGNIFSTGSDIGIALLAFTISFDVVAIAFALSRLFPHLGIRNWLQNEYWELGKTAIIIASIYGIMVFLGNLAYAVVPSVVTSQVSSHAGVISLSPLVAGAEGYLCNVNSNLTNTWEEIGLMSGGTGFWASFQVGFYIPIPIGPYLALQDGVSFLPFSNWLLQTGNFMIAWYGSIINDLVNFILFPFSSIIIGLITTLPALAYVGLTFFIPLGLVFRALPFIRGIGGTLIAIGAALCIVLPITLIFFNYLVTSIMASAVPIAAPAPFVSNLNAGSCASIFGGAIPSWLATLGCDAAIPTMSQVNTGVNFVSSVWQALVVFQTTAIYTYMNRILMYGIYMILQMLLFAIDLIIMYPLVDSIARSLGGTIRLSLGGKLKLAS